MEENRNNSTSASYSNSTPFRLINAPSFNLGLVIALGALIPLIVIGNSLVCYAFLKYQKLRTATNCFLVSLAISDLVVGLLLVPLWIAYIATGGFQELPKRFRDGYYILDISCSVASMTILAGVSVERWYGVCYPFRHMTMSINYAILTSIASWSYALGVAMLSLFDDQDNHWVTTTITCLGLFLPFVIMTSSYCTIARKIRRKTLQPFQHSGKECKTIRTLVMLSAIFIMCWLPFAIGSLVINYCDRCASYVLKRPALHIFPKLLHYANSCINPVLYSLFCPSFKSAFRQMFCGKRRRSKEIRRRSTLITDQGTSGKGKSNGRQIAFKEKINSNSSETQRGSLLVNESLL